MCLYIDRFEGYVAVIEYDGGAFDKPRSLLPAEAREGDGLEFSISIDKKATEERRKEIGELMCEVFD